MVSAVIEQVEAAASHPDGEATWIAPQVMRLDVGEAAGGDSFAGDLGGLS